MIFVMYVRKRRGLPMMLGSPDHVALRLRRWRLTTRQTVLVSYAVTVVLGGAGIAMTLLPERGALVVLGAVAASGMSAGVWLRRIDMSL
jgi:UDP-GlcNAc:undecaprenyl-phosphate GlcNAc-1-phosphate transferase